MIKIAIYLAILFVFFVAYIKYTERQLTFFPMRKVDFTPKFIGLNFEDLYLTTADNVRVNAWFVPADQARYTILFYHGNAGNMSHRLDKILLLHKMQLNVLIIDYRGYGLSSGSPTEPGIYRDGQCAYDYLTKERKIKPENILVFGESLGSAVAINLTSQQAVRGLILEGAFSSSRDMAKRISVYIPAWFFINGFDSLSKIGKVNVPKLFIHSRNDEIVPFHLAQKLYARASEPKQFTELSGGHNTAYIDSQEKYIASIASFIQQLSP